MHAVHGHASGWEGRYILRQVCHVATSLTHRPALPSSSAPRLSFIVYHQPGFDGRSLEPLCEALCSEWRCACYCMDIRGHGFSGGISGDAPAKEQVWMDIRTAVRHLRWNEKSKVCTECIVETLCEDDYICPCISVQFIAVLFRIRCFRRQLFCLRLVPLVDCC